VALRETAFYMAAGSVSATREDWHRNVVQYVHGRGIIIIIIITVSPM